MIERLTFNAGRYRTRTHPAAKATAPVRPKERWSAGSGQPARPRVRAVSSRAAAARTDWAWLGLLAFTAVLFLRPQDHFPPLATLHLAEVFAVVGLGGMVTSRMTGGLTPLPFTPEIGGLVAFGGAMLVGIPFSFWPGGSVSEFVNIYLKVLVIVMLMVHALDRADRLERFAVSIVLCSSFVAAQSTFDYMRGVNVWPGDRLGGAVGGILGNPNDLALNMVVFLPFGLAAAFKPGPTPRRLVAALCAAVMMVAIVLTKSRGGFLGLGLMLVAVVVSSIRVRPAIGVAAVVAVLAAIPLAPATFWNRMVSIFDQELDATGSRQARLDLMEEGMRVFAQNPVFGVGLGQFVNYAPEERKGAWNVTHNATLQVAAELGIVGLIPFTYLIIRSALAVRAARRALVWPVPSARRRGPRASRPTEPPNPERETLMTVATALGPALVGWLVCAQFASVALNWTLYFVLGLVVATREVTSRFGDGRSTTSGASALNAVRVPLSRAGLLR